VIVNLAMRVERMLVDIGDSGRRLSWEPIDVPKHGELGMSVEQIVDAQRGAPTGYDGIVDVEIPLPNPLPST